jgi:hypothetical protein
VEADTLDVFDPIVVLRVENPANRIAPRLLTLMRSVEICPPSIVDMVLMDSWRVENVKPTCVLRLLEAVLKPSWSVDIFEPTVVLTVLMPICNKSKLTPPCVLRLLEAVLKPT